MESIDQFEDICYYCKSYQDVISSYPSNVGEYNLGDKTPRCRMHWQYECHQCKQSFHFNGIAWCNNCEKFTCIKCSQPKAIEEEFLIYSYYYQLECDCGEELSSLDYAEYELTHPFQTGGIHPKEELRVWAPLGVSETQNIDSSKYTGRGRLDKFASDVTFKEMDPEEVDSGKIWDNLTSTWLENWPEGGDFNHREIIIPEVIQMLEPQEGEKILDVACGEGTICRKLTREYNVEMIGIDISKMLDHAIKRENNETLGITYHNLSAHNLTDKFKSGSFDKVVCNMALMDISDLSKTLEQISSVLSKGGKFVFSITHPCFSWPTTKNLKIPKDSQRNEDKRKVLYNYFKEGPTLVEYDNKDRPPILYFKRTLTTYFNKLQKANFDIIGFEEPKVSEELINEFPRKAYKDLDEIPDFLVIGVKNSDT